MGQRIPEKETVKQKLTGFFERGGSLACGMTHRIGLLSCHVSLR